MYVHSYNTFFKSSGEFRNCSVPVPVSVHVHTCLKEMFPKGSTAYTTVTKVAPSGLSRHIKVVAPFESSSNKQIRLSNQF